MDADYVYLLEAISEAKAGLSTGGIPIGAVLIRDDRIIGRGHNRRVQDNDPILHAEIDCLRNAGRIGSFHNTTLYSTLMPCHMCAGAVVQFGIPRVVAGESRNFSGAREFLLEHGVELVDMDDRECIRMMAEFIREKPELWNEDIGED